MDLIIVESPTKRKTIQAYLKDCGDYRVEASVGHVRDLTGHDLGLDEHLNPKFELTQQGVRVVNHLKPLVEKANIIYLATDPDREGEGIAWHLQEVLGLKNPKRITFNAITKEKVLEALKNPREINASMVASQKARRVSDRINGFLVSPFLRELTGEPLTAGRVQSVAVRLLSEREKAIFHFKPTHYYGVKLDFIENQIPFSAHWDSRPYTDEQQPYIVDTHLAQEIANVGRVKLVDILMHEKSYKAKPSLITTTLQQLGLNLLGYDTNKTMHLAQQLFEEGFISYHRTDSVFLSEATLNGITQALNKQGLSQYQVASPNRFKNKVGAEAAHEAIVPTDFSRQNIFLESLEVNLLYQLIFKRALASQLQPYVIKTKTFIFEALKEVLAQKPRYLAHSKQVVCLGWKMLLEDETPETVRLPLLEREKVITVEDRHLVALRTNAPARFTEASLIKRLEKEGIGRPSTYSSIMGALKSRGYVKVKNKELIAQASAHTITETLTGRFDFMELGYTKALEASLDAISQQQTDYYTVIKKLYQDLENNIDLATQRLGAFYQCPDCQSRLQKLKAKKGNYFWGCSQFSKNACRFVTADMEGCPVMHDAHPKIACPVCQHRLRRLAGKNKQIFWGCSGYQSGCKTTFEDNAGKPLITPKRCSSV